MTTIKKIAEVVMLVEVSIDQEKFTADVMREFSETIFKATTIDEHMEHIAQLCARDLAYGFVEGYGELTEVGISARTLDTTVELYKEKE